MSDLNHVTLGGRLTRDPELRHTAGGTAVVNMSLAFSTDRKQGDEWVEDSNFVELTAWGKRGEFYARKLRKGSPVVLVGELKYESWEAQDGSKRSKVAVTVRDMKSEHFFRKDDEIPAAAGAGGGGYAPPTSDDDIPF